MVVTPPRTGGQWSLSGLLPSSRYSVEIIARNARGISAPLNFTFTTANGKRRPKHMLICLLQCFLLIPLCFFPLYFDRLSRYVILDAMIWLASALLQICRNYSYLMKTMFTAQSMTGNKLGDGSGSLLSTSVIAGICVGVLLLLLLLIGMNYCTILHY